MKKIFTLCCIVVLVLSKNASSQTINEHFENDSVALTANCWQFLGMRFASNVGPTSAYVINGIGSLYSMPPVNGDSLRIVRTPFLSVGSSINVSFNYKLSNLLSGQQTRTISVDLINNFGVSVQNLAFISMDKNTNNTTSIVSFNQTVSVVTPGTYRLSITGSGGTGGGNARVSIDDLTENAQVLGCLAFVTLPVKLISFSGNLNNNKVTLQWAVAQNENDDHFEVEKSTDGKGFTTAGVVMASSKQGAESYSINDAVNSEKIYYRLKMFDNNQVITFSKTLVFDTKTITNANSLRIINNPATDKLTLSFSSAKSQIMEIKVYDLAGRMQMNQKTTIYQGNNVISLPLNSTFKTGMYAVELSNASERQAAKFVKQ